MQVFFSPSKMYLFIQQGPTSTCHMQGAFSGAGGCGQGAVPRGGQTRLRLGEMARSPPPGQAGGAGGGSGGGRVGLSPAGVSEEAGINRTCLSGSEGGAPLARLRVWDPWPCACWEEGRGPWRQGATPGSFLQKWHVPAPCQCAPRS